MVSYLFVYSYLSPYYRFSIFFEKLYQNQRQWRRSNVFIVNFEHILHLVLVFLLLTLSM